MQANLKTRVSGSSIPAPVEGWDASSPLAAMSPLRAIIMDNWFPQQNYIELRKGHSLHCDTTETVPVKTLMAYHAVVPSNDKLFSISNDTVYDVSTGTPAASSITTLTQASCQHVNFTTSGGPFLFFVNGADDPQHYNGTVWASPAITGVTKSNLVNVGVHKKRIFLCEVDSSKLWYLPVDSIAGAAASFELGSLMDKGGYLVATGSWSFDGGVGPDDHFVAVTSQGQVIVYSGDDPSDANAWNLVGVYNLPRPIGRRCLMKVAGDLVLLTEGGVLPLSKALIRDQATDNIALSARIQTAFSTAAKNYGTNSGWQILQYARGNMVIVNVPVIDGILQHQYVVNVLSGAWCRFTGQNAACWEIYKNRLFFGGNAGKVFEADISADDNGTEITADLKTAFNYMKKPGVLKRWQMIQPMILSDGRVAQGLTMVADFNDEIPSAILSGDVSDGARWDEAEWDVDVWPSEQAVSAQWQSVSAVGQCASIRMRVIGYTSSSVPIIMQLNGFNVTYEMGGFI